MRAVVSGATRGLGRAFLEELARRNYDLVIIARDLTTLQELKHQIISRYPKLEVIAISADLSKKYEAINAAQSVLHAWETIDVLINNVGLYKTSDIDGSDILDEMINTNLRSAYYLTQPLLPSFKQQKKGSVINICSVLSRDARKGAADYTISKHALYGFSKSLKADLQEFNIRVLSVLPGSVNTSSWDGMNVPRKDLIQPEDIARLSIESVLVESGTYVDELHFSSSNPNY